MSGDTARLRIVRPAALAVPWHGRLARACQDRLGPGVHPPAGHGQDARGTHGQDAHATGKQPRRFRIVAVSDSHIRHGRPALPRELLDAMRAADLVVHAGDIVDESGLAVFQDASRELVAVSGNVDASALVARLPERRVVETPAGTVAVVHALPLFRGGPREAVERLLGKADRPLAVIHGHTHRPEVHRVKLPGGRAAWVVNPGSVARSRGWGHTYAVIECDGAASDARIVRLGG